MSKIVFMTAGGYGVGRTTLALNLVVVLRELGKEAILVDTQAHVPAMGFDYDFVKNPYTLVDVVERKVDIESCYRRLDGITYAIGSWEEGWVSRLSPENFLELVDLISRDFDFIIFSSLLSAETLRFLENFHEVIFVTRPSLKEVATLHSLVTDLDLNNSGVIANMVGKDGNEISAKAIEFIMGLPVVKLIPYDRAAIAALSQRRLVVKHYPTSPISVEIRRFARDYLDGRIKFLVRKRKEETGVLSEISDTISYLREKLKEVEEKLTLIGKAE